VKQAEITLREVDHNQKIADESIQAQAEDRKDERRVQTIMDRSRMFFAAAVMAMTLAFVVVALWMNKDALVLDVVKVMLGFVGGWGLPSHGAEANGGLTTKATDRSLPLLLQSLRP